MAGYVETYRGQVLASECDLLGHMNIQFYIARLSHANWTMCYFTGMAPADIKGGKRAFASVQQDCQYLSELLAGDIIHMRSGVTHMSNKSLTLRHELIDSASGKTAMVNVSTLVYMDLDSRKAIPLTDAMRAKIPGLMVSEDGT